MIIECARPLGNRFFGKGSKEVSGISSISN